MKLGYQISMSELHYGRHHERVDHYSISISHIPIDIFPHTWIFRFHLSPRIRILFMSNGDYLLSASTHVNPGFVLLFLFFSFLCFIFCFVYLCYVSCGQCCTCLWIVYSWLVLRYSLMFYIIISGTLHLKTKHLSGKINPKCLNI